MLHFTEKTVELNGSSSFADFSLDAFANLEIETVLAHPADLEIVLGEVLTNDGRIQREPGGYRTIRIMHKLCPAGTFRFSFELPEHHSPCHSDLTVKVPEEAEGEIVPFRYVEVSGGEPGGRVLLRRREVFGPFDDNAASFVCSDDRLNRLWKLCKYTMKATSVFGCFVDGERERLPYEGDSYINQLGYFCCCVDPDIPRKTIDWLMEFSTWPTEWHLIMPLIARDYVLYSGDTGSLKRWLPVLRKRLLPALVGKDFLLRSTKEIYDIVDWPPSERDNYEFGEVNFVPNCYYYGALRTMAELTGEKNYFDQAEAVKKSIYRQMHRKESGLFADSPNSEHTSLHSAFFPLFFDFADDPEPLKKVILAHRLDCSVYGAQFLLDACYRYGLSDFAYSLMTDGGGRSWQNMLEKGATITMEAWDDSFKPNQDWNHAWGAAPANIIPRFMGGIRPMEPGFRKFIVDPQPGPLQHFELRHPTPHGEIRLVMDEQKQLHLTVPEGTAAFYRNREYQAGNHLLPR